MGWFWHRHTVVDQGVGAGSDRPDGPDPGTYSLINESGEPRGSVVLGFADGTEADVREGAAEFLDLCTELLTAQPARPETSAASAALIKE